LTMLKKYHWNNWIKKKRINRIIYA
jgi:hypothetical protein